MMREKGVDVSHWFAMNDQEVDLGSIFDFIWKNFWILAVCMLLGTGSAFAFYNSIPAKWKSDITLQIGKVPVMQNFDYIHPPMEVVEKIKSPLFLSEMISKMYGDDIAPSSPTAQLLYKDLKASLVRGSNLVTVNVFGWTAAEAHKNAEILADSLIAEHRMLAASYLVGTKKRLAEVVANIAENRKVSAQINAMAQSAPLRNEADALLKLALIDANANEIQKLRAEQANLEAVLSAADLQMTSIVGRSLVPQAPSSPKMGLFIIGGAFIGLVLGLLVSLGLAVHRRKLGKVVRS